MIARLSKQANMRETTEQYKQRLNTIVMEDTNTRRSRKK